MPSDLLIAIPVYNEQAHVDGVLQEVRRFSGHILVIDDGSTDSTPDALARHRDISIISHPENLGYGQSLADAFQFAYERGYRWLITMDCDGQHEACFVPRFIEAAATDNADVISGTRYPAGRGIPLGQVPPDRRRINALVTKMLNERLGLGITDAFCGFKAYRVAALPHLDITVPGYAMPMQLWVQVARARLRVEEIPVSLIYNDPNRHFGGMLDDPDIRLRHYLEVFDAELDATAKADRCLCSNCSLSLNALPRPCSISRSSRSRPITETSS